MVMISNNIIMIRMMTMMMVTVILIKAVVVMKNDIDNVCGINDNYNNSKRE